MPKIYPNSSSKIKFTRRKDFGIFRKVIELRKRGYSYTEISKETRLAKSTINNWLRHAGLTLSPKHFEIQARKRIENHELGMLAARVARANRKKMETEGFIQNVKRYFPDPFFVAGVMLYEAEGSKGENNNFSNSDFRLISIYIKFIEKYFLLNRHVNMVFRLYIHESRKTDLERIKRFWEKKIHVNSEQFRVTWKRNVVVRRRTNLDYEGQMSVGVRGIRNFTGKILSVSDIILNKYQKICSAESSNGRTLGFGPRNF